MFDGIKKFFSKSEPAVVKTSVKEEKVRVVIKEENWSLDRITDPANVGRCLKILKGEITPTFEDYQFYYELDSTIMGRMSILKSMSDEYKGLSWKEWINREEVYKAICEKHIIRLAFMRCMAFTRPGKIQRHIINGIVSLRDHLGAEDTVYDKVHAMFGLPAIENIGYIEYSEILEFNKKQEAANQQSSTTPTLPFRFG